jgi:hypothetical protein
MGCRLNWPYSRSWGFTFCFCRESNFDSLVFPFTGEWLYPSKVPSKGSRNSLVWFTGIATANKEMQIDILRRLSNAVRRKSPEKGRINGWFLLHDNASAHRSVSVTDFVANNNVTTQEHPLYSPNLAPADFRLFPRLKSALKRRCCCGATDITKNATKELKRLS